jgi:SAM-dependent methyltransferase
VGEAAEKAAQPNDRVVHMSVDETAELPTSYFDVATMNDVLEDLTWPEPALATARRILRQGGKLVLSLPNVQFLHNVLDLAMQNDWQYQDSAIFNRTLFGSIRPKVLQGF